MRILLVNWARLPDGPLEGGGVNGYCGQLAAEFIRLGHEVSYLSSGITYTRSGDGGLGRCEVRRLPDHAGVRIFDVVNSPVVAPGPCQARHPAAEISSPVLAAEIARFTSLLRPEVVHLHNVEGLSADCFPAFRASRARLVYSLHNYHTVCPQVYLMQQGVTPCRSFDAGRACVGCADKHDPAEERLSRAGPAPVSPVTPVVVTLPPQRPTLRGVFSKPVPSAPQEPPPPMPEVPLPGAATLTSADLVTPSPPSPVEPPRATPVPLEPLDNDPNPDPWPEHEEIDYARRRRAFVNALSGCDRVLAVSEFVRSKFVALGVKSRVVRTLSIGSRMTDLAVPNIAPAGLPLRIAFLGYHNHFKGLHCLLDAMDLLAAADLARLDFFVSAKAVEPIEARLQAMRPRLARLAVEHGYTYENIPNLLRDRHVGIVPSVWWDNGPQTVFEFLACGLPVVGANLGGIPDFVTHEHNGLLFRGNDRPALAAALSRLVNEPDLLSRLRENVRPPKSMQTHAAEVLDLYSMP